MIRAATQSQPALSALLRHWPEYALEALELGLFLISACAFAVILFHPSSAASQAIESSFIKRALMGLAMGLTAVALIFSPMGQRSGAHMNPAVTLTFWRLGKIQGWDTVFYILAQFIGATMGVLLMRVMLGELMAHHAVNHVATLPGTWGMAAAWTAEFAIALILMCVVLVASNHVIIAPYTGLFAGILVALYITFESPISGTSLNPARTFGSAYLAQIWTGVWIYFTAPPLAMLIASELYLRIFGGHKVYCAKLHHYNAKRCIFRCNFKEMAANSKLQTPGLDAPPQMLAQARPRTDQSPSPEMVTVPSSQMNEILYYG